MRAAMAAGVAMAAVFLANAAQAGTPYPVKMTCPVGGESFTFIDTMSSSTWGQRADGKPYGSWEFPQPLPECPRNRLVIFTRFTPDQIEQLKPLVASSEYKALASETSYYRALWLAKALKIPEASDVWLLLQASWQADRDPERKARYQRELVAAIDAEPAEVPSYSWFAHQVRAVNAERELGRFEAAEARVVRLREALSKPSPYALTEADKDTKPEDAEASRKRQLATLEKQSVVIARRDAGAEPLELISPRIAARKCIDLIDDKQDVPSLCEGELLGAIARERAIQKAMQPAPKTEAPTSPSTPGP